MPIECLVLGAGQEVGKSCVVVTINGKRIMFDCGMHMRYKDLRQYPDFSLISDSGDFTSSLSCVIITHFHLDHIGALPYFTQVCGYEGPIYMTYPTKALAPLALEDYRNMLERGGEKAQFTSEHIAECMKKVTAVDLKQTIHVDKDLQIRAYYAGHVLGAAMFYAKVGDSALVYTGDYNMVPDRHLGAAQIDRLQLDLVISESTYATTYRDSKYVQEREFLKAVHKSVASGGKVLIPSNALGRTQELCMLLDDYWERTNLKVPIYFSSGSTIQANLYHKILINWASQNVKDTHARHNAFDFRNVRSFDRSLINAPGPCVLFASPGNLNGGFSLEILKQWAPYEENLVMLPGSCSNGIIGSKLMSAKIPTQIKLDENVKTDVRCQIHKLAFSAHTDGKGIMDLVTFLSPKHVLLVHGEKPKMAALKEKIQSELGIECCYPANNETVTIPSTHHIEAGVSDAFLQSCLTPNFKFWKTNVGSDERTPPILQVHDDRVGQGMLTLQNPRVFTQNELRDVLGVENHQVKFAHCCAAAYDSEISHAASDWSPSTSQKNSLLQLLFGLVSGDFPDCIMHDCQKGIQVGSFVASLCSREECPSSNSDALHFRCTWSVTDEELAWKVISLVKNVKLSREST
ncbi:cleavage and polyadenylation specificity factor subunit 3-II-like isoform X1 [Salvia splendens]|uniref:cleavage and polyadenylation specificity factor subunit 3-II-like isoform X1 n=1 Tax=Salvia splendens TaxID=180675 RepID=UPI001C26C607|nr:cleavage and polyadenylation specificity factor subunit 3-II-like isoform X1 [Salvia splendens]XP_042017037.1 cleavage and polyadenylation specificity factor subunit 3-II-like isoform X1 [Salvia splendens]XP_042017038.1 cleavage and polyadenylation specificity factor subunit 3-II-like isoform X1 [Salvia splendens]